MFLDFILLDKETRELRDMNRIMKAPLKELHCKSDAEILILCEDLRSKLLALKVKKAKWYLDSYLELLDIYENIHSIMGPLMIQPGQLEEGPKIKVEVILPEDEKRREV